MMSHDVIRLKMTSTFLANSLYSLVDLYSLMKQAAILEIPIRQDMDATSGQNPAENSGPQSTANNHMSLGVDSSPVETLGDFSQMTS